MKNTNWFGNLGATVAVVGFGLLTLTAFIAKAMPAGGQEMQARVAEVKQLLAFNKQALSQYSWIEQQIISVKGEQKKEELYNVQLGPTAKRRKRPSIPTRFPTATGRPGACGAGLKKEKSKNTKNTEI